MSNARIIIHDLMIMMTMMTMMTMMMMMRRRRSGCFKDFQSVVCCVELSQLRPAFRASERPTEGAWMPRAPPTPVTEKM